MLKIQDVVDGVINAMRTRGCCENTLKEVRWSVYTPIIRYHSDNGTDVYSNKLLEELCQKQEERYLRDEISRKFYRAFVTAAFRIRSYVNTGEVDFSIVKDSKLYKPVTEHQELIDAVLRATGTSQEQQYKLSIVMRQFFCFFEEHHTSIAEISDRDFIDFIPVVAEKNPNNMNCVLRSLRYLIQYLNEHHLAKINVDLKVFSPKAPPHRLIAPFTQDDITAMLGVIENNSQTPKRDAAIILLAFNSGLRCADSVYHQGSSYEDYLFYTTRKGVRSQMSSDAAQAFIKKYGDKARATLTDLPHLYPHLFRHTRAMHLYMAGMPLELVSQWLGHSQMETSLIYARATTEMKRKAINKISSAENSVFKGDEKFKYADNEFVIQQLYGLI